MTIDKLGCVLMNPEWTWGSVNIDGTKILLLSVNHPVHGIIYSLLPREVVKEIADGLSKLLTKK